MAIEFYPYQAAEALIEESDIEPDEAYNERDGLVRAQLTAISTASAVLGTQTFTTSDGKTETTTLKKNVYKTIHRLHASANKKNIDFAANVKNTVYNTVQFAIMEKVEAIPTKQKQETVIRWTPSQAEEADPFHALNYGKTMTLDAALKKGLGTRYGCQCGMIILNAPEEVEQAIEDLPKL